MAKVTFHAIRNCLYRREFAPRAFKRSSHYEKGRNRRNHCLIQQSLFDVRNFFSVLATPLVCANLFEP